MNKTKKTYCVQEKFYYEMKFQMTVDDRFVIS